MEVIPIDELLEVWERNKADTPQTEAGYCNECRWFGDKQVCGRCRSRNLFAEADTPQTEYPCETCANKGDHDGKCRNCVTDSEPIRWKTPSNYEPKQTERIHIAEQKNCSEVVK